MMVDVCLGRFIRGFPFICLRIVFGDLLETADVDGFPGPNDIPPESPDGQMEGG